MHRLDVNAAAATRTCGKALRCRDNGSDNAANSELSAERRFNSTAAPGRGCCRDLRTQVVQPILLHRKGNAFRRSDERVAQLHVNLKGEKAHE